VIHTKPDVEFAYAEVEEDDVGGIDSAAHSENSEAHDIFEERRWWKAGNLVVEAML